MTSPSGSASGPRTRVLAVLLIGFSIALRLIAVFQRDGLVGEELMVTLKVGGPELHGAAAALTMRSMIR